MICLTCIIPHAEVICKLPFPLYFCVFASEFAKAARAGLQICAYCGSFAETGCRFVSQLPPKTDFAIFSDSQPPTSPELAADALGAYCRSAGIMRLLFDFERPYTQETARFFAAFSSIHPAKLQVIVPERYMGQVKNAFALCCVSAPCSNWEAKMAQFQASYGDNWCLELAPWRSIPEGFLPPECAAVHPLAKCHLHFVGDTPAIWDSGQSLKEKLAAAARHNCRFALGLLQELMPYRLTDS